jgi:hypothetical protein
MLPKKKKKREESAAAQWCFKVYSPYNNTKVNPLPPLSVFPKYFSVALCLFLVQ